MRYGLPYKGSKNQIAEWIIDELPSAPVFVDLFCGGCAVTHRAMLSGKYKAFIINDIDERLPRLFLECLQGKHTPESHPEFVSRAEFFERKDKDAEIALVWSFGNDGQTYIYGADIEEYKKALHIAVFTGDLSPLKSYGLNISTDGARGIYGRYKAITGQIKRQVETLRTKQALENFERLAHLERLQRMGQLENLERLQRMGDIEEILTTQARPEMLQNFFNLSRLEEVSETSPALLDKVAIFGGDYTEVDIPAGALIYCDIPYFDTNCGKYGGFNHPRFYEWARGQDNIFISEYQMPPDFVEVANIKKAILSTQQGATGTATEKLFTNQRTFEKFTDRQKERARINSAVQLNLFDFM